MEELQNEAAQQATQNTSSEPFVPKPNNYLVLAIFTTLCCCLPLGIYAIVLSTKVNNLYIMKQYEAAQQASDDAKKWSLIGIGVGIVFDIIYTVINGAAVLATMGQ